MIINQVGRLCIRYVLCVFIVRSWFICVFSGVLGVVVMWMSVLCTRCDHFLMVHKMCHFLIICTLTLKYTPHTPFLHSRNDI